MKKDINQKLNWGMIFSFLIIFLGAGLLIYMITIENEPGALPLILIISGLVFLLINRYKTKKAITK